MATPTRPDAPGPTTPRDASPALFAWLGAAAVLFVMAGATIATALSVHDTETVCETTNPAVTYGDCLLAAQADSLWFETVMVATVVLGVGGVACLVCAGLASFSRGRSRP